MKKADTLVKVVDETAHVRCSTGNGIIREEVWQNAKGMVLKYNLAFINHLICAKDNGRVLGYDNDHNGHHRHYMGTVRPVNFSGYAELLSVFLEEVGKLRRGKVQK